MKTIIQAAVLFVIVIMITITSISFVVHHTLKSELISSVSNGAEKTLNMLYVYNAYLYDNNDEVVADLLQNIIMNKSSKSTLTVNIYNKDNINDGILEVEAIEHYKGLGGVSREASYRVKLYVYQSENGSYLKYADPSLENSSILSEQWVFTYDDTNNIKNFLKTSEGKVPPQARNQYFVANFSYCKK